MREVERKTQWCPHRRHPFIISQPGADAAVAANAAGPAATPILLGTCIGHECSQWRWEKEDLDAVPGPQPIADAVWVQTAPGRVRNEPPRPAGLDPSYVWSPLMDGWARPFPAGMRHGHCGLAGAPGPD